MKIMNNIQDIKPAVAVDYVPIRIPPVAQLTEEKLNELILAIQGDAVEILDAPDIDSAMKVFHFITKYSPECVYKIREGSRIMIFDHQVIPIIRDMDIVSPYTLHDVESNPEVVTNLSIDIESLWHRTNGEEIDRIKQFLDFLRQLPSIGRETTLVGNVSVMVALFAQYFVSNIAKRLYYQVNESQEKILIY